MNIHLKFANLAKILSEFQCLLCTPYVENPCGAIVFRVLDTGDAKSSPGVVAPDMSSHFKGASAVGILGVVQCTVIQYISMANLVQTHR